MRMFTEQITWSLASCKDQEYQLKTHNSLNKVFYHQIFLLHTVASYSNNFKCIHVVNIK